MRQDTLARRLSVDPGTLAKWERGKSRPFGRNLAKLTDFQYTLIAEAVAITTTIQSGTAEGMGCTKNEPGIPDRRARVPSSNAGCAGKEQHPF